MKKNIVRNFLKAIAIASAISSPIAANAIVLPACQPGVTCLQFGDFNVFSMPLLNAMAGAGSVPGPGDPYYASSTYGAIQNYTILGINNGQSTPTGNPPPTTDGAYNTPSPNNDTNVSFSTGTTADPAGGPAIGDRPDTWDTTVGSLLTLAGGTPVTAFFAFNETGSGTGLLTTDLLIWVRATLYDYDAQGNVLNSISFYLSGDGSTTVPGIAPGDLPDPNNPATFGPWVWVHAGICIDNATQQFAGFPDINGQCGAGQTVANQNNLGQNAAAFAVNSPALDAALLSGLWDVLSIDWRMAYINGGGETAWIQPTQGPPPPQLPEPGTLALGGLALLALALVRRRT